MRKVCCGVGDRAGYSKIGAYCREFFVLLAALAAVPVTIAAAADMPLKAPPVPYAASYNWTGFYVGGEVGGDWVTSQGTVGTPGPPAFPPGTVLNPIDYSGVLGGAYAGYNYQINQFVLGIDGDYTWADLTGTSKEVSIVNGNILDRSSSIKWISTVTGRLGYANNNWLFFAKGGWAWAGRFSTSGVEDTAAGVLVSTQTVADTRNGGTVGAGVEWGFATHWSAKLEYDYVKFATSNATVMGVSAAGVAELGPVSATSSMNMLKAGIAYRF